METEMICECTGELEKHMYVCNDEGMLDNYLCLNCYRSKPVDNDGEPNG